MGNIGFVDIGKMQKIGRMRTLAELDSWNCPGWPPKSPFARNPAPERRRSILRGSNLQWPLPHSPPNVA
jgi:hypothetical protein